MSKETGVYKDPFIQAISFLYDYLLLRLRNDKEGDFYIGIEEYKLLIEAANLQKNTLTIDKLANLFCLLFAKSQSQELRLMQHFNIVLQAHQEVLKKLRQAGIADDTALRPENFQGNDANTMDEKKKIEKEITKKTRSSAINRKELIKKQIAKISLPAVLEYGKYEVSQKYIPANKREMSIFSRRLQKGVTSYSLSDTLDVEKTIQSIAKQGFFLAPVFAKKKTKTKLTLLVDTSPSMIPFEKLIVDFAMSVRSFVHINTLYFNNYPVRQMFFEKQSLSAINLKEWVNSVNKNSFIIIISDGGAARGGQNEKRITHSQNLIRSIKERTNRAIWLNPMPVSRWMDTTAWALRESVNMYSFSRFNLEKAMEKLGV